MTVQTIRLRSRTHYGRRVPPQPFGQLLEVIPAAVRQAVRMRFEGRSGARGKRPGWLRAAADVRFLGHDGDDDTLVRFEAPELGEAAPRLYAQPTLWTTRPDATDTGLDLLADVLADVAAENRDSDRYDAPLLRSIVTLGKSLSSGFDELELSGRRATPANGVTVTSALSATATRLFTNTPHAQRVRVVGTLDMIEASTESFALILDDGQRVRGTLPRLLPEAVAPLWRKRVLVLGQAIYRPSGRVLRLDAEELSETTDTGSFFSAVPRPVWTTLETRSRAPGGLTSIIGRWPGDESDEEVAAALRELS